MAHEEGKEPTEEDDIIRHALKRWELANHAEYENRDLAVDDQRFLNGEHWPVEVEKARETDKRPTLTINRFPAFLDQVVGDQRLNKASIKVRPVDDDSDVTVADIQSGIIRNIEYLSSAEAIYDYCLEQAAGSGMSYFMLATQYENEDSFLQEPRIKVIKNSFSTYLDPNAKELDKSDAEWGFVIEDMAREEFHRKYPEHGKEEGKGGQDWSRGRGEEVSKWFTADEVRVASYYKKVRTKRLIALLSNGAVVDKKDATPEALLGWANEEPEMEGAFDVSIQNPPLEIVKERTVEDVEVLHYKITGAKILEGPNKWVGKYIPIIPVCGKELNVQGRVIYRGLIRFAKDSARMYNYWRTAATEVVALAPKTPWVATAKQIEGYEHDWKNANTQNISVLTYKHQTGVPMPQRTSPASLPVGMVNEAQVSVEDMKAVIGIYDAKLGARSNEKSGVAIRERKRESDVGTFAFIDNLHRAIGFAGRQLVDIIPKLYDTPRIVRIRGLDDKEGFVMINQEIPLETKGKYTYDNKAVKEGDKPAFYDLKSGKYDVVVETGPSFSTQRVEASESMISFVSAVPAAGEATMDLVAKAQDWPNKDEFVKRLEKILPEGMVEPEEGAEEEPPPPPSPQEQMAIEAQQREMALEEAKIQVEFGKLEVEKMKIAQDGRDMKEVAREEAIKVMEELHG